jgi:hypothetical protein
MDDLAKKDPALNRIAGAKMFYTVWLVSFRNQGARALKAYLCNIHTIEETCGRVPNVTVHLVLRGSNA